MILILVVVFGLIGGGGYFYLKSNPQKEEKQEQKKEETVDVVLERFNKMTLEEKIGQMIFIAHRDTDYDEEFIDEFKTYQPGGFILFKENITSFKDVKAFNERLQSLSYQYHTDLLEKFHFLLEQTKKVDECKDLKVCLIKTLPLFHQCKK